MHLSGDWIVPRVAGEPWLDDPPFYHWLALAFAKAFGGLLGFHNAVRLASGVAMLAALWFLYLAARHRAVATAATDPSDERAILAERRGAGAAGTLLLLGSIGLIVHAHEAVPDLAALAAAVRAPCACCSLGKPSRCARGSPSARRSASRSSPPGWWCRRCWAARRCSRTSPATNGARRARRASSARRRSPSR